ncbi:prepilin-type N-terminal cleavage/methylation domain-containing protein [Clostridium algidicarnis]|uniref:prepilin-type N-terminal cleavage/methylation domain-containing protein n=1 Tax=Clostridium algidicarnis TaxID=37659 RepID=UPI00299DAD76|nr:prepilin-type N-terminal cleavage/methylation domain-containing protein [Clostridium algidicarnis]
MKELLTKERKKKKGFTLIELIIVLAIIAIIAAIAIPNFTKVRTESKVKADTQSAETIRRITLTLVTDEKVLPGDKFTVTEGTATKEPDYFKEVRKPQQGNIENYEVTVDTESNVTVVVGEVTVPEIKE